MRIAVASGKGGTGKTTVATGLALSLVEGAAGGLSHPPLAFLDCDVEAPSAHLFLPTTTAAGSGSAPEFELQQAVDILIPRVDATICTACGRCAEVCEYHAIVLVGKRTMVFPQLCHGCGSCSLVCPDGAISEEARAIGVLERRMSTGGMALARGVLNVGEPMATPAIRQLKKWAIPVDGTDGRMVILDTPPGTSCPMVEAVRGADYLLLVTEPTPFGLHDLRLAVEVAATLAIPAGVIINRDGIGDAGVEEFCAAVGLPVLLRIPYERAIAEGIAQGRTLVDIRPEYAPQLRAMALQVAEWVKGA